MPEKEQVELLAELSRLARELKQPPHAEAGGLTAVPRLVEVAHALGVPTNSRRDDAPVFLEGTERVETATWTQCGGLLFALAHEEMRGADALAARVAERIFDLAPTHRRAS
jgi:hypothetical protein